MNADQLKKSSRHIARRDVVIAFPFDPAQGIPLGPTPEQWRALSSTPCARLTSPLLPSRKNKIGAGGERLRHPELRPTPLGKLHEKGESHYIGVPCQGVASAKNLTGPSTMGVESLRFEGDTIVASTPRDEKKIALANICPTSAGPASILPRSSTTCSWESRSSRTRARRSTGTSGDSWGSPWKRRRPTGRVRLAGVRAATRAATPALLRPRFLHRGDQRSHWQCQRSTLKEELMFHMVPPSILPGGARDVVSASAPVP